MGTQLLYFLQVQNKYYVNAAKVYSLYLLEWQVKLLPEPFEPWLRWLRGEMPELREHSL